MERRHFIRAMAIVGGTGVIGAGLWTRTALAERSLSRELVSETAPILVEKEHSEIAEIPAAAAEEMKLWFTGVCLNSAEFVDYLCTERFASRLQQFSTQEEKELCVQNEFFARIMSPDSIYQRIELIAQESGAILDRNWQDCCDAIARKWQLKLDAKLEKMQSDLHAKLDFVVAECSADAISQYVNIASRPTLISTSIGAGETALLMLRLTRLQLPYIFVIPGFAFVAVAHFANYAVGVLGRNMDSAKAAISDRIALLGSRVAAEFKAELRERVADLHSWQNEALRKTAGEYARAQTAIF